MTALVVSGMVLLAAGLAFLLVPLLSTPRRIASARILQVAALYREQLAELERDRETGLLPPEQYEQAATELKRRMLQDVALQPGEGATPPRRGPRWALPAAIGTAMPLAAVLLYLHLGAPQALEREPSRASAELTREDVEAMVERLAARMKENSDDVRGWAMLGRSYQALGRYTDSAAAYERALALRPDDPHVLTGLAATLHRANGRAAAERVGELASRALAVDPDHHAGLAFAGGAAYERGEYAAAIGHWQRLQQLLPEDSELAAAIRDRLSEARSIFAGTSSKRGPPRAK